MHAPGCPESDALQELERALAAMQHDPAHCVHRHIARTARVVGARFDEAEFHDVLLRDGPITLPMQRAKVNQWIEETRHANV